MAERSKKQKSRILASEVQTGSLWAVDPDQQAKVRHPGVEPGPPRWQREIITARLMTLLRHLQDSNLRGQGPVDFESTALTTRPRCLTEGYNRVI